MTAGTTNNIAKGRQLFGALLVLLATFGSEPQAAANPLPPQAYEEYENFNEGQRVRLLIQLAKSGNVEAAQSLLQRFPLQGPHAANRRLYLEGLILKSQGKLTAARDKFRATLASDPSLTLVRADLAETLVALEEDEGAKHHLRLLEAEAPTEEAALGIRSFIDQIDTRRPYTINAYLALAPTTNINNRTYRKTVYGILDLPENLRAEDALGIAAGINGSFNKRLGDDLRAIISGNVEARLYDHKEYHSISTSQAAELRHTFDRGYASVGLVASQDVSIYAEELSYISYGPRLAVSYAVTPQDEIRSVLLYEWQDYQGSSDSDSGMFSVDLDYTHAFDSTFTMTASAGFRNTNAKDDVNTYDTWSGGLSVYKEFGHGITVDLSGEVRYSEFTPDALSREDWKYIGSIALTKRDFAIFGLAPSLQYTYVENDSSNEFFDFYGHSVELKFTKAF